MSNHLADELSPYLLQHAGNPVEWYAWGPAAIEEARAHEKPIFLSIGYSACHWCHVMAHESFEDEQIARQLSTGFISVKVDREERPELDQIYMEAVQMMTGHGGWPLSVFLTPSLEPFFGGTYWPSHAQRGVPGFDDILRAVDDAWRNRREQVLAQAGQITQFLNENRHDSEGPSLINAEPLVAAEDALRQSFDARHGGFGGAPKFPQPMVIALLLRRWCASGRDDLLEMATAALDAMARGGICDHLGGGFHRYAVDDRWLVPHFEKMLYDNALLAGCYLDAWQATSEPRYARVVRETLDYLLRDMQAANGALSSSEDADSEGAEGKFYLWTPAEIEAGLGEPGELPRDLAADLPEGELARLFCRVYDVTPDGNFEGRSILHLARPLDLEAKMLDEPVERLSALLAGARRRLLEVRNRRVRPGRDDKALVSWNGLAIEALARAGQAMDEPRYTEAAVRAAEFLLANLRDETGRLLHCWRDRSGTVAAFLDDYASFGNALVSLNEATGQPRWGEAAERLADEMLARFADPRQGGFFYTTADHEPIVARKKDVLDAATPSGNSLAAMFLLRLGHLRRRREYAAAAERTLRAFYQFMRQMPTSAAQMLMALDLYLAQRSETEPNPPQVAIQRSTGLDADSEASPGAP